MKRKIFILLSLLMMAVSVSAQRVRFEMTFESTVPADLSKVYVQPLNVGDDSRTQPLRLKGNTYTANVPVSTSGFYELVLVINNGQWMSTIYSVTGEKVKLNVKFDGSSIVERSTVDNRALSALNSLVSANNRRLWLESGLGDDELKSLVTDCFTVTDSIIKATKPSAAVVDYLRAWAYTSAQSLYSMIPRTQERKAPFTKDEVLPSVNNGLFDNERAILLPSVRQFIYAEIATSGVSGLDKLLGVLYERYKCEAVRATVADMVVERFLTQYDYASDFNGGLDYLKRVVKDFALSNHYIDNYMKHKAMIVGADFPENVVLVDAKGNKVDFSTFEGKYVYIDLWASWCGPCCKEVPYLQALEKELEGGDVVFVSISVDTDAEAWKAKMEQLNMHGNQLIDRDGELCNMLNVEGIPFFVVYDKKGKLHTYGALRPSSGTPLKQFLQDLP